VTFEDDRDSLARQLAGWNMLPLREMAQKAEADRAAAEARQREIQAAEERRQRQQAQQAAEERHQRDNDRARLQRLELQWANHQRAAMNAAEHQRRQDFWAARSRALDELVAMTQPPRPVETAQMFDPYFQGSTRLGDADFNPTLLTAAQRWW
jgi:hypothetical protein